MPLARTLGPLGVGRGAAGPITLISDALTDTDGVAIASHVIGPINNPGVSWANGAGTYFISSNRAKLAASVPGGHFVCGNCGYANVTVSADVTTTAMGPGGYNNFGNGPGVVLRWVDAVRHWRIELNYFYSTIKILEFINTGSYVERASAPTITIVPGTFYRVSATASGTSITATVNGGNIVSYASATNYLTSQRHGAASRNATDLIDNVLLTTP